MSERINSNYSTKFQQFVDFANKSYATNNEDAVMRFSGMPSGDYKGSFASFKRTSAMKSANDQVRDQFRNAIADMFGGEQFIPDLVRDNMKLDDFGKGKPLTARRIKLVKTAIDLLGGGMFASGASVEKAHSMGYLASEMPKLARVANLYQQATGCSEAEAEKAALDPGSKARLLFDCGGRFTLNADNFKKGLALMDKFAGWFGNLQDDYEAGKFDTLTKLNLNSGICNRSSEKAVLKFLLEEIAVNGNLPLEAENPEDVFGMANNSAMRFIGRNYTMSFANSLAQIPQDKRSVLYAVFDAFDKLPANAAQHAKHTEIDQGTILAARVMKHFDAVSALQTAGKLDRAHLVPLLYPDLNLTSTASTKEINDALNMKLVGYGDILMSVHMLASHSGATLDEAADAIRSGRRLDNAPWISSVAGHLEELDGTPTGGRKTMIGDLDRPTTPEFIKSKAPAIAPEDTKFVFHFTGDETLVAKTGPSDSEEVRSSCNAIADKLKELCGEVHPKQLSNVYFALSQSAIGGNLLGGLKEHGIKSNEHMAVTFTISRNDETGAITIKYSEPKGMPVKFNWTMTIDVDGNSVTTPMRIDHGQYDTEAMKHVKSIADQIEGKNLATAEALVKDLLAYCGDDFDLKDIVSKHIDNVCINGSNKLRSTEQIKARIDAIRANLAEVRAVADGNANAERAGVSFLSNLLGKSVPPGLIGKITKAAATANPGEYAKLSVSSSPKQLFQAVVDLRAAIEQVIRDAHVNDVLDGGDEMTPARIYVSELILTRFSNTQLQGAVDAFRSETAQKLLKLVYSIQAGDYPRGAAPTYEQKEAIQSQAWAVGFLFGLYNMAAETVLGKDGGEYREFNGPIDKNALGHKEIFQAVLGLANDELAMQAEETRQNLNIGAEIDNAKAHATNAYSNAGEGNDQKVNALISTALQSCAANADAVHVVANNMDAILVTNTANLRSTGEVRERAEAIAANFAELKELSKDNPAIYEAGKRMMDAMGGKALPPGLISRLVAQVANVKIDAIHRITSRSSALDIHDAVTQFRDNLVQAMDWSGAETATVGPDEKQACRNFIAALIMNRCGAKALRAMHGAFAGDTPSKMLSLYMAIGKGDFNENLSLEDVIRLEDRADSHMKHLVSLKDAIDLAVDGHPGTGLAPFVDQLNADEIDGGDIYNDLLNA